MDFARDAEKQKDWNTSNFGPVPSGSTILWQTEKIIVYQDSKGKFWRHMKDYRATWPIIFKPDPGMVKPDEKHKSKEVPIEELI
jgi:hypothetical protein